MSLALPFLILLVAGVIFDSRMLFIALMIPFIFAPVVMSHIYYSTLLQPEARRALSLQKVILEPGKSMTLVFLRKEKQSYDSGLTGDKTEESSLPSESSQVSIRKGNASVIKDEELEIIGEATYNWNRISEISLFSRNLVIELIDISLPVVIPLSSMPADFDPYSIETVAGKK